MVGHVVCVVEQVQYSGQRSSAQSGLRGVSRCVAAFATELHLQMQAFPLGGGINVRVCV